jgi:hypothetical protein
LSQINAFPGLGNSGGSVARENSQLGNQFGQSIFLSVFDGFMLA